MSENREYAMTPIEGHQLDNVGEVMGIKRKRKWLFWKESDNEYKQRIVDIMRGRGHYVS